MATDARSIEWRTSFKDLSIGSLRKEFVQAEQKPAAIKFF